MWERVPLLFSSCSVGILCVCCSCSLGWMSFWEGCHLLWPSLERGSISVQGWWANSWLSALRTRGWDLTDFTPTFNPRCPSFRKRKKEEKLLGLWPIFITLTSQIYFPVTGDLSPHIKYDVWLWDFSLKVIIVLGAFRVFGLEIKGGGMSEACFACWFYLLCPSNLVNMCSHHLLVVCIYW